MKKSTAKLSCLACLFLLVGTGAAAQDPQTEAEEKAVRSTLIAMWEAIELGNVDAYARFIHPDYTGFGESDVYLAEGKELEVRGIADWVERAKHVHTEMHQPKVTIRGDVAWIVYYWTDSGISGDERFSTRGKSTRIFVKEDGRWLCIHGHFTAVP